MSKKLTQEQAVEKFKAVHGDRYDYSLVKYINDKVKVKIICSTHGVFEQDPHSHSKGSGCRKCMGEANIKRKTLNLEKIIGKFRNTHGNKYDYSLVKYVRYKSKVKIICPRHGLFEQAAGDHARGSNCPKCTSLNPASRGEYIKICNKYDGMSNLYIVECSLENESFYKVGIARLGVKDRYKDRNKDRMPYSIELIYQEKFDAGVAWDLEKQIHKKLKNSHYTPSKAFKGSVNECFTEYILPSQL